MTKKLAKNMIVKDRTPNAHFPEAQMTSTLSGMESMSAASSEI